ncbi:hypothetical protein HK102_011564 [Quaeritorhiza haematococci]|uniref:hypothetical protein n=1 Tax=Paludisphaera soli TaxID=2712865 RepID=UPI0013EB79E7|nr:hypothetical protein [Paludisphaera soli]KAJ3054160.1 hypothetical protein HK102_011564 [Quaeritorhiza haematococci]
MSKSKTRTPWLDDEGDSTMVHEYAAQLGGFMDAMADGKVEKHELQSQEARVVELMKKIEPQLDPDLHEDVTRLLCELSAYNIMHTFHSLLDAAPKTKFRG